MKLEPPTPLQLLFAHPLDELPYNLLRYRRTDVNGAHIYEVFDTDGVSQGVGKALNALKLAVRVGGGQCFYCPPTKRQKPLQRDHVEPIALQGVDDLFNLVLACEAHNSRKGATPMAKFNRAATALYMTALHSHLTRIGRAHQSR